MYFLLDLERTILNGVPVYWKEAKRGYTHQIDEAGVYSELKANEIVESDFDKHTVKLDADAVRNLNKQLKG